MILARTLEQGYCVPVFHHTRHGPVEIKTVERQQHIHSNELLDLHPDGSDLSPEAVTDCLNKQVKLLVKFNFRFILISSTAAG